MKKLVTPVALFLLTSFSKAHGENFTASKLGAQEQSQRVKKSDNFNSAIVEARVSYFRPFSKIFRELSKGGGISYGLETTIPVWRGLNVWGELDYFSKNGTAEGIDRSVEITMVPITAGLKYIFYPNHYFGLYGGAAGKYYFVKMVNKIFSMPRTTHRSGLGGVFEVGGLICLHHFVIDIFASCSIKRIEGPGHLPPNASSYSFQVGGWNVGAGLGYKF